MASRGEGIDVLMESVARHLAFLVSSGRMEARRLERLKDEAADLVGEWSRKAARRLLEDDDDLAGRLEADKAPYGAAESILKEEGARLVPGQQ